MDRRARPADTHNRNRSEDLRLPQDRRDLNMSPQGREGRSNGRDFMHSSGDVRFREELQNLIETDSDGSRQMKGRSRSPRRQENKRAANGRTSPNRRVSWHDSVEQEDPTMRNRGQSPEDIQRGREQSPRRGRERSPNRGRQQSPQRGRRQSPNRGRQQSPNRGRQQSPQRGRRQSPNRGRQQSPNRGRQQSPQRGRKQSPQRIRKQQTAVHSSSQAQAFQMAETHSSPQSKKQMLPPDTFDGRSHKRGKRSPRKPKLKTLDARLLDAETATARVAVLSIVLHLVAIGTALMVIVPLALISSRWMMVRTTCPLYVRNNIGYTVDWGNPNMMVCHIIAYLPIVILVLSFCLILFHYGILHTWYTNKSPPKFALTRKYAVGNMLLVFVEAVVGWSVACLITDGFRQTCLSFELTPAPEDRPISCKYGYDDRDETYMFRDLNTFQKLMVGMFGAWACALSTTILFVSYVARTCCCYSS